jgi:hypothetical protein
MLNVIEGNWKSIDNVDPFLCSYGKFLAPKERVAVL